MTLPNALQAYRDNHIAKLSALADLLSADTLPGASGLCGDGLSQIIGEAVSAFYEMSEAKYDSE